jgi:hypothetical protein
VKILFLTHRRQVVKEVREAVEQIALSISSVPATTEETARAYARTLRDTFMGALPKLGAPGTIEAMRDVVQAFRRDVEAKGFDVSTEIYHVYLAIELLDRPLETETRDALVFALSGLATES